MCNDPLLLQPISNVLPSGEYSIADGSFSNNVLLDINSHLL